MINEKTLEARLHSVLENVFPTFRDMNVIHQQSFSIKFGHHAVKVDLKDPSTYPNRAIFDMLLTCAGKNVMLVELKNEELQLDEEDVKQGLSYTRLIEQMPPLVLISNGHDNLFYDTYSAQKLDVKEVDFAFIEARIRQSFELATSEFRNTVELLLNKEPELVGKVIRKISQSNLDIQCGDIYDLDNPICKEFQIGRRLVHRMGKAVEKKGEVIGLLGQAFSGKTCILYQFFRNYGFQKNKYVLYVDFKEASFSLFQHLANEFAKETKGTVSKEKIREWLISMTEINKQTRFILLVDNLKKNVANEVFNEFSELIEMFRGTRHSIIYSVDEWGYGQLKKSPDRNYRSLLGKLTKIFRIKDLNEKEYERVNKQLYKNVNAIIQHGGKFCSDYRKVRILRRIALSVPRTSSPIEGGYQKIQSVANLKLVTTIAANPIFTEEIHLVYSQLAAAFVIDKNVRKKNPDLKFAAISNHAISKFSLEKIVGNEYDSIIKTDLVVETDIALGKKAVLPKLDELITVNAIDYIFSIIKSKFDKEEDADKIYRTFIDFCSPYPSGDIVAHGVLEKVGQLDVDLFNHFLSSMLEEPPVDEAVKKGTQVMVLLPGRDKPMRLEFGSDMPDCVLIAEHFPYMVLANLLSRPMLGETATEETGYEAYLEVFYRVASVPQMICRIGKDFAGFKVQPIPEVGTFLALENGIIDIATHSMYSVFLRQPQLIEALLQKGKEELNYHLLWRILTVASAAQTIVDEDISRRARSIVGQVKKIFFEKITETIGIDNPSDLVG